MLWFRFCILNFNDCLSMAEFHCLLRYPESFGGETIKPVIRLQRNPNVITSILHSVRNTHCRESWALNVPVFNTSYR